MEDETRVENTRLNENSVSQRRISDLEFTLAQCETVLQMMILYFKTRESVDDIDLEPVSRMVERIRDVLYK